MDLAQLRSNWEHTKQNDGGHCPVCDRWGKIYPRGINRTMARSLIWLAAQSQAGNWVDVPNTAPAWVLRSNQLPTLRWWDLVERNDTEKSAENKHSGMWRATEYGKQFASNKLSAPSKVFTYNGEVVAKSTEMCTIVSCFEYDFDYQEVFNSFRHYGTPPEHN